MPGGTRMPGVTEIRVDKHLNIVVKYFGICNVITLCLLNPCNVIEMNNLICRYLLQIAILSNNECLSTVVYDISVGVIQNALLRCNCGHFCSFFFI